MTLPAPAGATTPVAATLFGEAPSRVLVSMPKDRADDVMARARNAGVHALQLGQTTEAGPDATLRIAVMSGPRIEIRAADLRIARESCLESIVGPS